MITLALETSTTLGSVALLQDDTVLAEHTFQRQRGRDELFDAIAAALRRYHTRPGLIAVGIGPGSFTGIRMAIAAAKGLALPDRLPLKAACSFDALALAAASRMPPDCAQLCVLCDACREEIYYALYDRTGRPVQACRIAPLETLADEIHAPVWFISPQIHRYRQQLRELFGGFASVEPVPLYPSATAVGRLALERYRTEGDRGDEQIEPLYLRHSPYPTTG
jgi:tRNA threonylcarbamoyl adenosine modification protein YeaZ